MVDPQSTAVKYDSACGNHRNWSGLIPSWPIIYFQINEMANLPHYFFSHPIDSVHICMYLVVRSKFYLYLKTLL